MLSKTIFNICKLLLNLCNCESRNLKRAKRTSKFSIQFLKIMLMNWSLNKLFFFLFTRRSDCPVGTNSYILVKTIRLF